MTDIYYETMKYAIEHDEDDICRRSREMDQACRRFIKCLIAENHSDFQFDAAKVIQEIVDSFGAERVSYIFATTIQDRKWDGRISDENKRWARNTQVSLDKEYRGQILLAGIHSTMLNKLVDKLRKIQKTKYSVTALRQACIDNDWFTEGSNEQYEKLFYANANGFSLEEIATIIWVCSDDKKWQLRDIKNALQKLQRIYLE